MIGFILPNAKGNKTLRDYAVTIDEIESITRIDFFPQLEDQLEDRPEGNVQTEDFRIP